MEKVSRASVIALVGGKRVGKDSVADVLVEKFGFKKIRIADRLKKTLEFLFELDARQLEDDRKDAVDARLGVTPRALMQWFGTEVMQFQLHERFGQSLCQSRCFWVESLVTDYALREARGGTRYVISDMRFLHEYRFLEAALGDQLAAVAVVGRCRSSGDGKDDTHASETAWKEVPCDHVLENSGSMDELVGAVERLVSASNISTARAP